MRIVGGRTAERIANRYEALIYVLILLLCIFSFSLLGLVIFSTNDNHGFLDNIINFAALTVSTGALILLFLTLRSQQEEMRQTREVMDRQLDLIKLERRMSTFPYLQLDKNEGKWEGGNFCVWFYLKVMKNPFVPMDIRLEDERLKVIDPSAIEVIVNEGKRFKFGVLVASKEALKIHDMKILIVYRDLQNNHYSQRLIADIENATLSVPRLIFPLHLDSNNSIPSY